MFGFGRKKEPPSTGSKRRSSAEKEKINDQLAKLGLIGIPGIDGDDADDLSDGDLENELLEMLEEDGTPEDDKELQQLLAEDDAPVAPKRKNRSPEKPVHNDNNSNAIPVINEPPVVHAVTQSNAAPDANAKTEDLFKAPPPPKSEMEALQQRLDKYKSEADKARNLGDAGKSRRMGRIVKQYEDAIKAHQRGKEVAYDDLPTPPGFAPIPYANARAPSPRPSEREIPPVQLTAAEIIEDLLPETPSTPPESRSPKPSSPPKPPPKPRFGADIGKESSNSLSKVLSLEDPVYNEIYSKQKAFKEAALRAKHEGQIDQAKELLRIAKGFDKVISDHRDGQTVDLSALPSVPESGYLNLVQASNEVPPSSHSPAQTEHQVLTQAEVPAAMTDDALVELFKAPPPPTSIMEALEQRLHKYKSEVEKAKEKSDAGKTRRMGRIVKQYEDAIKAYKNGREVQFEELPTPPGFAPIPVNKPAQPAAGAAAMPTSPPSASVSSSGTNVSPADPTKQRPTPPKQSSINRGENKPGTKLTLQEKQLNTILTRQKQFKEAAINAKQRGDMEQAKEFLRTAKGFDKLIGVSQGGLPVDMSSLPAPPESVAALEAEDFELVSSQDCLPATGSTAEIFSKLEADLREQMAVCMRTRNHLKTIGDVGSANRFEQMAIESKKDLDALRLAVNKNDSIPKYHYESKIFSITECNSDLGEDDIEISILKGVNYRTTEDVDTFIKVELPYPTPEEVQSNKTAVAKNSNNPDYNATYKFIINRGARNFPRFVHRHGFKLEVWAKGGLFRSSNLIGVVKVNLSPLETKCTLHDAFDILDGRKVVGKLEVKVRLRDPVLTKEITQKKQKWLSLDRV